MKAYIINRITNHEIVVEDVTYVQIKREDVLVPSNMFEQVRHTICTVVQLYSNELIVGTYPVDDYYVNVME